MAGTTKPLTPQMVRSYIQCEGERCPYCGSDELESGPLEADGGSAWAPVECGRCGQEWRDVFFLGAIDTVNDLGAYCDTIMPAAEDVEVAP